MHSKHLHAAATLCTKTVPAMPRRPTLRLSGSAQSSDTITISTCTALQVSACQCMSSMAALNATCKSHMNET